MNYSTENTKIPADGRSKDIRRKLSANKKSTAFVSTNKKISAEKFPSKMLFAKKFSPKKFTPKKKWSAWRPSDSATRSAKKKTGNIFFRREKFVPPKKISPPKSVKTISCENHLEKSLVGCNFRMILFS